ncbi:MAG: hypothetical protein ACO1TE_04020 [Prosthecobacter sp.]
MKHAPSPWLLLTLFVAGASILQAQEREIVLFPFDDHALPFTKGLLMNLNPGHKSDHAPSLGTDPEHPGVPVMPIGKKGDPDYPRAYFCGTILKVEKEYRMWYSGFDGHKRQVCHATSKNGTEWTKPKLGLVDYNGSKDNNLVCIDGADSMIGMINLVLHDPEDPDPERRFKMVREINPEKKPAAISADGLRWKSVAGGKDILDGGNLEPSGFIKFNGAYYIYGHGGPVPHPIQQRGYMRAQKRMMVTVMSYDFEHWTTAGHVAFRRDSLPPRPVLDFEFHRGEQVHLGASVWNRGNVLLGFYGQYHNDTNDRRTSTCDIGLVVSHDGIHFKEPLADFKLIPSFEEDDRAEPRLTQGQAFHNIGDRTFVYYGIWTEVDRNSPTGVRVATWPRDRLGFFAPAPEMENAHCISSPLASAREGARVYINATGLSATGTLTLEVLDERLSPIPGYSAADFVPIEARSGLRVPVKWRGGESLGKLTGPVRIRVNWSGEAPEKTRLFAIYIENP